MPVVTPEKNAPAISLLHSNLAVSEEGHLLFAGQDTVMLAKQYGTPLYLLDYDRIRQNCRRYQTAMRACFGEGSVPLFAGKSLCFTDIYRLMAEEGMSIDVVSPGELYTAQRANFPLERGYFHGNNKTDSDIAAAMDAGIGYFVADSREELLAISREAARRGICQKLLLRITPGIDPHTHKAISTGQVDSKFGTPIVTGQAMELAKFALSLPALSLLGFHCHIGSQIFDSKPFCDAADLMLAFAAEVRAETGFETKILNLGGGFGVRYRLEDPLFSYEDAIAEIATHLKSQAARCGVPLPQIRMEPGRSIVADAGLTLYTVGTVKEIPSFRNYVSVDGGMPDNPRYALYQSPYTLLLANRAADAADYPCTVAGRCCESGDLIQENVLLAKPSRGDLIAVAVTGAYNYAMASNYNRITRPPIVALEGGKAKVVVRRESFEDLTACDL